MHSACGKVEGCLREREAGGGENSLEDGGVVRATFAKTWNCKAHATPEKLQVV